MEKILDLFIEILAIINYLVGLMALALATIFFIKGNSSFLLYLVIGLFDLRFLKKNYFFS